MKHIADLTRKADQAILHIAKQVEHTAEIM